MKIFIIVVGLLELLVGSDASFRHPWGLAIDSSDNLYVSRNSIIENSFKFLNSPYLWGGKYRLLQLLKRL